MVSTHLCYSEFEDIMEGIDGMDADLMLIENSRSDNLMLHALKGINYGKDIGAGVYDIHSPVVPTIKQIVDNIKGQVDTGILDKDYSRIWVNPDCGLKTRKWPEVHPSIENIVEASKELRSF